MLGYFPKYYTDKAMYVYFALLVCVPVIFGYPMEWYFWIFGIVEVVGFFYFAHQLPIAWKNYSPKAFAKKLFTTALIIRVVYVMFSYWFYNEMTGMPFEFGAADVMFYNEMGQYGHKLLSNGEWNLLEKFKQYADLELSDSGYPIYLTFVYWIFDDSILITRIIKCFWSAWTCVLVYKLASRNFGDSVGRMSAIFCMLMPNLIYYCGIHLKETEMVFIIVLFAERADYAMRAKQLDWKALIVAIVTACILFLFRTALAAVAMIALATTLMLSSRKVLSLSKKIAIGTFVVLAMFATVGNQLMTEAEELLAQSGDNQSKSMEWRAERKGGNEFAKYAGAAVFAPLIFTIPFPTLVDTPNHENQRMIHGGNYVKNITSAFTIFALFTLLLSGNWRKHVLIIAVGCGYLVVIALSAFAQSERFHLPALPFSLILAALGISMLSNKQKKWFNYWLILIFVANIAWAWFKLRGRGM
jgi:4-amino-4-deoxy-L-arabinose transferase-like glycosyltransferase